jgi:lysophospholipase L1-like esterase
MRNWKRIFAVMGLVLFSTCGGLVVGELSLRRVGGSRLWGKMLPIDQKPYYWLTYHPILGWVNKPGDWNLGFLINRLGFRGPDLSASKSKGSVRIVCMGDSRTFGLWLSPEGLRYDNDYPAALEESLREQGGLERVEVINAGVVGYTSAHGLAQLQTEILQLQPDIVTVAFGFNDHNLAWNPVLAAREPHHSFARELFYVASHSYWFQLAKAAYDRIGVLHALPLSQRWVEPGAYQYNLHRFAEIGRSRGIRVLFVSQALRPIELGESATIGQDKANPYVLAGVKDLEGLHQLDRKYRYMLYEVAGEEDVPVADASLAFSENLEPLFSQYDLVHCNPAGARLIAETIRRKLIERGWLSSFKEQRAVSAAGSQRER